MAALLLTTLQSLEQAEIQYCLLRDADQVDTPTALDEIDLLVAKTQMAQLQEQLAQLGFIALPSWGHAPHRFFIGYDAANDHWLKLDVVTDIVYGHPYHTLYTDLASACLAQRRRQGTVFAPATVHEFVTLLLHCVLDKGRFAPHRRQRLQTLREAIQEEEAVTTLLQRYWQPGMSWAQLGSLMATEQWDELLALRKAVRAHLAHSQRLPALRRYVQQRLLRKVSHLLPVRRPRSPSVAILAPDGAGKSTVVSAIQQQFYFPVYTTYMGLYQKSATQAATAKTPGAGFMGRLTTQWRRYLAARYQQAKRKLVIFDRYPYDALLPSRKPGSRLQQGRRWILAHACPAPDLVILLDAPGETLFARKGEHSAALLEEQRQFYLKLQTQLRQMVVVDATQSAELVRRRVIAQIWRGYLRKNGIRSDVISDAIVEKAMFDLCVQE